MVDVGYVRTSTKEQDLANQIRQLKDKGVKDDHIFEDGAVSGITPAKRRNGFRKLLQFIEDNADSVDRLYVFELSRLGRSF